jgi:PBSX family phage terminase large subunit
VTTEVVHRYRPRGAARDLFGCRDPEVLLSGPAGTGKSRAALEKVNACALKYPGMRALFVRKVRDTLGPSVLATWRARVIPEALAAGHVSFYGGSAEEPPQYRYANGSTIALAGMDKATKIMSTDFDLIYVAEAIELDEADWEALTTRLRYGRMPYQQLLADTNPGPETHWLRQRADRGATTLLESRHEDNPVLYGDDGEVTAEGGAYLGKLDRLSGVRYQRLRRGLWVAAEGMVYDAWDPTVHVVDRFEIPDDWPRYLAIDWGHTNPMVVQWWAEDPDGRLYRYRELYQTGLLASEAGEIVKGYPERIRRAVADHDSGDREAFRRASGVRTRPAEKSVDVGIGTVAERLAPAGDGRPRVFFLRGSLISRDQTLVDAGKPTCTEEEIPGYVWDRSTAQKREKEVPVKENDHGCDAWRYQMMDRRRRRGVKLGAA